jgi:hypothetical protein
MEGMTDREDHDPRARWRVLPPRVGPDEWVSEKDTDPVPGSVEAAEAQRESRERRQVIEWGAPGAG